MKQVLRCALVLLLVTGAAHAQTAKNADELTALLKEFLDGASRNDVAMHDRFWAEDVIYTGSSGKRRGKAEIMKDVRSAPAPKAGAPTSVYTAEEIRIQQYGNAAVVAFRLVATMKNDDKTVVSNYLNSGTFIKRKGKWQVVNWQSTKVPPPQEAAK